MMWVKGTCPKAQPGAAYSNELLQTTITTHTCRYRDITLSGFVCVPVCVFCLGMCVRGCVTEKAQMWEEQREILCVAHIRVCLLRGGRFKDSEDTNDNTHPVSANLSHTLQSQLVCDGISNVLSWELYEILLSIPISANRGLKRALNRKLVLLCFPYWHDLWLYADSVHPPVPYTPQDLGICLSWCVGGQFHGNTVPEPPAKLRIDPTLALYPTTPVLVLLYTDHM